MMFEPVDSSHHHSNPQFFYWSLNHMHELRPRAHTSAKGPPTNGRPWPVQKDLAFNKRPGKGLILECHPFPSVRINLPKIFSVTNWTLPPITSPLKKCLSFFLSHSTSEIKPTEQDASTQPPTTNHQPTSAGPPRPQDLVPLYELCSLLHQRFQESSLASSERKRNHLAYGTWGWFRIWFIMSNCLSPCFPKKDHPL